MTIQAATIIDEAATLLLDALNNRTWPLPELLGYFNEALRATAFVKPDMYTVQTSFTPVAGVLQSLPSDGTALLDITRNLTGRNRVVTQVDEGLLEEANRFWPAATQQAEVEHFTADPRNPRRFRVFPPANGAGSIEILYGAVPPQANYDDEDLPVPDSFQTILLDFILARAYSKNSKRQDLAKASYYRQNWAAALGLKSQAQVAVAPHVAQSPGI
jgi:hypothetical protein